MYKNTLFVVGKVVHSLSCAYFCEGFVRKIDILQGALHKIYIAKQGRVLAGKGQLGYKEKPTVPFVECTVEHSADMSLQEFADMVGVIVSFDTDSKRSFVLRNAWNAKALEMDKGSVALRFEAMSCEEI